MRSLQLQITLLVATLGFAASENVLMTEVFAIAVDPFLFNWTSNGGVDDFLFQPFQLHKPDLPPWISYVYSTQYNTGYLYGVPPPGQKVVLIEIVGLNKNTYETKRIVLNIAVAEKRNPAKNEVQIKIDNLNVEHMFDVERMERLKDLFRKRLWKESQNDLYITFLDSAVKLGGRLPLNPNEAEGVVLRVGSAAHISQELMDLQEEVKPLWKVPFCPRDFKRTTVDRFFREAGFALDWCSFRLLYDNTSSELITEEQLPESESLETVEDPWLSLPKDQVPKRNYSELLTLIILLSFILLGILLILLSIIVCLQTASLRTSNDTSIQELSPHNETQNSAPTLKSLCAQREHSYSAGMYGGSPNNTLKGGYGRPSPPPYIRPNNRPTY